MIIYFVRHADALTGSNLSDKEKFRLGLTQFGKSEARALAKGLKKLEVECIFSSPIERARETAKIISAHLNTPVTYDDKLKEFSPDLDGKDGVIMKELKKDAKRNPDKIMPAGESFNQAVDRLESFIHEISHGLFERAAVITHRVVLEGLLARLFGIKQGKSEWIGNASVAGISVDQSGIKLMFFDRRFSDFRLFLETVKRRLGLIDY